MEIKQETHYLLHNFAIWMIKRENVSHKSIMYILVLHIVKINECD